MYACFVFFLFKTICFIAVEMIQKNIKIKLNSREAKFTVLKD